jgi:hypothetical protein
MTPTTTLTLGDFAFGRFEIPETIPFGGDQRLVVHELIGGKRVIDAMGYVPTDINWSGWLVGAEASSRAFELEGMAQDGVARDLSWAGFLYSVVIKSVHCDYRNFARISYQIALEVSADLTTATGLTNAQNSVDDLIAADLATSNGLASGFGSLSGIMGTLNSAISAVSSFAGAAQSTLNTVLGPIAAVQSQVGILINAADATIRNVTTLGGLLPNNPVAQMAYGLTSQITAVTDQATLVNLNATLGRMQNNIGTITSGNKTLSMVSGDLYHVAATQYGDPMGFTAILNANNLTDPQITGLATIKIPAFNNNTGGILNA